ncbi:spectinomycin phosphotransferase [Asanoa ferruginea]|uniref:Spectinomycin phosphotransferase n=1 Tax=Asanoa ferruginea TaxID=53367 RepID=A0A3D9ZX19_9ACTN|nr:aminoglycoside phosphotransferase family protein [Asanoa ferruginea]REG01103.1 spectinomycin phosphotransferase [Asanoa ferruginea]
MIEKPDIPDSVLVEGVHDGWGLFVDEVVFLPVGLDGAAWAYEVRILGGGRRFLKVRTGEFTRPALPVPSYLFAHGLTQVVAPIGGVHAASGLRLALYPFIDGENLWSRGLTDAQWTAYGRFLGALHAVELPDEVAALLPIEAYASTAPHRVRALADQAAADPALGPLWRRHSGQLSAWADEAERLECEAAAAPRPIVVCHADIHPGNLLADGSDDLRVVDWDAPVRAPRERDLMFVFGTEFGEHPINARREAQFRSGYGPLDLDDNMLRYYRLERRLDDVALFAATVLDESATEAARAYELELLAQILER